MKKNECAQEMILDLVMRMGCEVILRPVQTPTVKALEIVFRHKGYSEATIIDFERLGYCAADAERITCEIISRSITRLFRFPYDRMIEKHFREGADNA